MISLMKFNEDHKVNFCLGLKQILKAQRSPSQAKVKLKFNAQKLNVFNALRYIALRCIALRCIALRLY